MIRCLDRALSALEKCGVPHEVLLVDDASPQFEKHKILKQFPKIIVIQNKRNLGFGPTCNMGARLAKGNWILFLNNDCYLNEDYFIALSDSELLQDPMVFSLQGGIFNTDGKRVDAAKFPRTKGFFLFQGIDTTQNFKLRHEQTLQKIPTVFSSGCNAFVNKAKFDELKGFDDLYAPFYTEDADLGLRSWRKGWNSYYIPRARCIHEGSDTISKLPSPFVRSVAKRNRWVFHIKHLPLLSLLLWLGIHFVDYLFANIFQRKVYKYFNKHAWPKFWSAFRSRSTPYQIPTSKVVDYFNNFYLNNKKESEFF